MQERNSCSGCLKMGFTDVNSSFFFVSRYWIRCFDFVFPDRLILNRMREERKEATENFNRRQIFLKGRNHFFLSSEKIGPLKQRGVKMKDDIIKQNKNNTPGKRKSEQIEKLKLGQNLQNLLIFVKNCSNDCRVSKPFQHTLWISSFLFIEQHDTQTKLLKNTQNKKE